MPLPSKNVIDVHAFVTEDAINPLSWDTPYYVGLGDKAPAKPYALLAQALHDSGQVAVTKVALRGRESLAVLREIDGLLVLQTVKWPDEIRSADGIHGADADEPVNKREIKMALQYAAARSEGYDLEAERDAYVIALEDTLKARAADQEPRARDRRGWRPQGPSAGSYGRVEGQYRRDAGRARCGSQAGRESSSEETGAEEDRLTSHSTATHCWDGGAQRARPGECRVAGESYVAVTC